MLISPSFSPDVLVSFIPTLIKHSQNIVADIGASDGKFIDPMSVIELPLISMALEASMGLKNEMSSVERLSLRDSMKNFFDSNVDLLLNKSFVPSWRSALVKLSSLIKGEESHRKKFMRHAMQIIKFRLQELSQGGIDCNHITRRNHKQTFLDNVLSSAINQKSGDSIDLTDVLGDLANIMIASYDTILSSTIWFFYNMSINPDIQEKLFEELSDFDEEDESVIACQVNRLTFLDQCVKENLRIYPSTALMSRKISEAIEINGHLVPAGTLTATSIYAVHHDETIYPDPYRFDPSRFEPDNLAKIPSGAYIPFGAGPRRCIGERLALLQSKIIFSSIVKKFHIEPSKENNADVKIDVLTRAQHPFKFSFMPRDD